MPPVSPEAGDESLRYAAEATAAGLRCAADSARRASVDLGNGNSRRAGEHGSHDSSVTFDESPDFFPY